MNGRGTDCTDFARVQTPSPDLFTPNFAERGKIEQSGTPLKPLRNLWKMVLQERIELSTSPLPRVTSASVFAACNNGVSAIARFACTPFAQLEGFR